MSTALRIQPQRGKKVKGDGDVARPAEGQLLVAEVLKCNEHRIFDTPSLKQVSVPFLKPLPPLDPAHARSLEIPLAMAHAPK